MPWLEGGAKIKSEIMERLKQKEAAAKAKAATAAAAAAAPSDSGKQPSTDSRKVPGSEDALWFCIVLPNPFHEIRSGMLPHIPPDGSLRGYDDIKSSPKATALDEDDDDDEDEKQRPEPEPACLLRDEDFFRTPNFFRKTHLSAPNMFQKQIELVRRLLIRNFKVEPADCLVDLEGPPLQEPWNWLEGVSLREDQLVLSADGDEHYLKLHAPNQVLKAFAEKKLIKLRTNPYSNAGGLGVSYTRALDESLSLSVQDYLRHHNVEKGDEHCKGKDGKNPWGFSLSEPTKMRLAVRLLKDGWTSGGCGLRLDKMVETGIARSFFPLRNDHFISAYGLDEFCSFKSLLNLSKLFDFSTVELGLISVLGEQVTLYFVVLISFSAFLLPAAAAGVLFGLVTEFLWGTGEAVAGCLFTVLLMLWGASWCRRMTQVQSAFSSRHGQEIESRALPARESFRPASKRLVDLKMLFGLNFDVPLTMQRDEDGTMIELVFQNSVRLRRRYLVSYPLMAVAVAGMVACLVGIQFFRMSDIGNLATSIAASVSSVAVSIFFKSLFSVMAEVLTSWENPDTDLSYEHELVRKNFLFYGISTYLPALLIVLWPNEATGTQESNRKNREKQLRTQLFVQLAVMPMVQNVSEMLIPIIGSTVRKRIDEAGGICMALLSFVCCCCFSDVQQDSATSTSTAGDDYDDDDDDDAGNVELGAKRKQQNISSRSGGGGAAVAVEKDADGVAREEADADDDEAQAERKMRRKKKMMKGRSPPQWQQRKSKDNNKMEIFRLREDDPAFQCWSQSCLEKYASLEKMEDMLELCFFFGWVVMFGSFSWAAPLSLFYLLMESKIDGIKLLYHTQRPIATVAQSLGPYNAIFKSMLLCAVLTNGYYFAFVSRLPQQLDLLSSTDESVVSSDATKSMVREVFIYLQYIFGGVALLVYVQQDEHASIAAKAELKQSFLSDPVVRDRVAAEMKMDEAALAEFSERKMQAMRDMDEMALAMKRENKKAKGSMLQACWATFLHRWCCGCCIDGSCGGGGGDGGDGDAKDEAAAAKAARAEYSQRQQRDLTRRLKEHDLQQKLLSGRQLQQQQQSPFRNRSSAHRALQPSAAAARNTSFGSSREASLTSSFGGAAAQHHGGQSPSTASFSLSTNQRRRLAPGTSLNRSEKEVVSAAIVAALHRQKTQQLEQAARRALQSPSSPPSALLLQNADLFSPSRRGANTAGDLVSTGAPSPSRTKRDSSDDDDANLASTTQKKRSDYDQFVNDALGSSDLRGQHFARVLQQGPGAGGLDSAAGQQQPSQNPFDSFDF